MTFLITLFAIQVFSILLNVTKFISSRMMISLIRFSYAIFLLFSGFLKLIDPLGFSYKLQEYFEVFGMEWLIPLSLFLAIFVVVFELFLGFFLIYGVHVKKVMWGNLLLMLFFTFLTFFSAYFNKVTDCGCFGDFMKLDPWDSFFKDVYLVFISIVLFIKQKDIKQIWSVHVTNRLLIGNLLLVAMVSIYTLLHIPLLDFRAYKVGTNIVKDRQLPSNAKQDIYEDIWYYEVNEETREFSTEDEPWKIQGAVFKDRKSKLISKGDEPLIHDFDIIDEYSGRDMTDSILSMDRVFLLITYDIEKTNLNGHSNIRGFIQSVMNREIPVFGLSSSSAEDLENRLENNSLKHPYFLVDQITLKTMIRANPGLFLLENGFVIDKWHWRDVPDDISFILN